MCHCSKRCQISCLISLSSLVVYTVDLPPRFVGPLTAAILLALDWGVKVKVVQLCPALWDPKDHSLSSSSVHGILQARILEWIAIPFSRGSSPPKDQTLHCRQIFLPSEPPGRPKTKEYPLFSLELILLNSIRYTVSRCLSTVPETCHDLHPKGTCLAD